MAQGGRPARLVVSVHDVAPSTLTDVRWLLARLDDLGIDRRVLKVIPDEAWTGDLRDQPEVVALLSSETGSGSEIVVHGLTHRSTPHTAAADGDGRVRATAVDRVRARLFAGDAAEFLDLAETEASARIERGLEILAAVGFRPGGFCAPAWLARPGLGSLLRDRGFRFALWFASVEDLETGRRLRVPTWGYMGAGETTERLVAIESRLVRIATGRSPLMRVFLHPQRARTSKACTATLRALERARRQRIPSVYADILPASIPHPRPLRHDVADA